MSWKKLNQLESTDWGQNGGSLSPLSIIVIIIIILWSLSLQNKNSLSLGCYLLTMSKRTAGTHKECSSLLCPLWVMDLTNFELRSFHHTIITQNKVWEPESQQCPKNEHYNSSANFISLLGNTKNHFNINGNEK